MIRTITLSLATAAILAFAVAPAAAQDAKTQWRLIPPEQPATLPPAPTWRMQPVTAPLPAPAVDCARMDGRLRTTLAAFAASCEGQRFRGQVQQCITIETETLAAAQQFLPHTGTCKTWTAAQVRMAISEARRNLALFNETMAAGNSPRGGRGSGGGYSGSSNTYVGPDIGYSACQRFMIQADGSKYCY